MRKPINKLRFFKFLKKAETDQKYEETDLKFEETDQQNEILKFLKKAETDQKYEETNLQIRGNWSKKRGNYLTLNIGKRIQNIWKSLNNSELLRDFLEFKKKMEIPQK